MNNNIYRKCVSFRGGAIYYINVINYFNLTNNFFHQNEADTGGSIFADRGTASLSKDLYFNNSF